MGALSYPCCLSPLRALLTCHICHTFNSSCSLVKSYTDSIKRRGGERLITLAIKGDYQANKILMKKAGLEKDNLLHCDSITSMKKKHRVFLIPPASEGNIKLLQNIYLIYFFQMFIGKLVNQVEGEKNIWTVFASKRAQVNNQISSNIFKNCKSDQQNLNCTVDITIMAKQDFLVEFI